MNKEKFVKVYDDASAICRRNFDKYAKPISALTQNAYVNLLNISSSTRKVDDWGRDEDSDVFLVIDSNGAWCKYTLVLQIGAGKPEVIKENLQKLSFDDVWAEVCALSDEMKEKLAESVNELLKG